MSLETAFSDARVLVLYSNPINSTRLRLDKEYRAVDRALDNVGIGQNVMVRLNAVSVDDFALSLQRKKFEIIQFSGHGSEEGIFLEKNQVDAGELVDSARLAAILRSVSPSSCINKVDRYERTSVPSAFAFL